MISDKAAGAWVGAPFAAAGLAGGMVSAIKGYTLFIPFAAVAVLFAVWVTWYGWQEPRSVTGADRLSTDVKVIRALLSILVLAVGGYLLIDALRR